MYRDLCFVPDFIKIIINIVTFGLETKCRFGIVQDIFLGIPLIQDENDGARTFIEKCGN
jgi:hypothetical protein